MKRVNALLAMLVVLALAGCAATGPTGTPEEIVAKRAQERWNYLLKPDYEKAYEYLSPGYRAVKSYRAYLGTMGSSVKRTGATVTKVTCESPDVCEAIVEVSYFYAAQGSMGQPGDTPVTRISEEKWVKVDGKWWLYKDPK